MEEGYHSDDDLPVTCSLPNCPNRHRPKRYHVLGVTVTGKVLDFEAMQENYWSLVGDDNNEEYVDWSTVEKMVPEIVKTVTLRMQSVICSRCYANPKNNLSTFEYDNTYDVDVHVDF